jgi:two-component system response regulator QseB
MRVLIVEDDELVASGLKQGLQQLQYTVDGAASAEEATTLMATELFDIAVVDIGLPRIDGLSFVAKLRASGNTMPVLMLTARDSLDDTVKGLDVGADDYMTKPFRLPELGARMRALLRRSHDKADACIRHGALTLDTRSHTATFNNGQALDLTKREWLILEMLLMTSPAAVSKERLLQGLAGWDKEITPNAIEVHISRLRAKLEPIPLSIRTIRGIGYRVDPLPI